jgi:hypothetical protein
MTDNQRCRAGAVYYSRGHVVSRATVDHQVHLVLEVLVHLLGISSVCLDLVVILDGRGD